MESADQVEACANAKAPIKARLHYIDWLRALAVLGVFVYHSLQPFSTHHAYDLLKQGRLTGRAVIDPQPVSSAESLGKELVTAGRR